MHLKRVIPCLDVDGGRVVKGTKFLDLRDAGDPVELAARYDAEGADELVFLDITASSDARGRQVAVKGWTETTGADLVELAKRFEGEGVAALIVTEIGRDGTMAGPDLDQLTAVLEATAIDVVASGGVGTLDDLRALAGLRAGAAAGGRPLAGVIVGRAIYEGRFTVEEALACLAPV